MKSSKKMAAVIGQIAARHGLDLSRVGAHLRVENDPYMALCIEVVAPHQVSVAHYGEQNGDAMADPEMVFWTDTIDGSWIPISLRNDYATLSGWAAERVCTIVKDGRITAFLPREQADQALFANAWARNLHDQGFLDVTPTS